ncbi:MAG: hypothetical protein JSS79_11380 [Bacteroidetes bacterium]|nr:hypothetical protein [Bacteroidota bacterium]
MIRIVSVLLMTIAFCLTSYGQRVFSVDVDSITRSYLLTAPNDAGAMKLPLIILLHGEGATPYALSRLNWAALRQPAVIAFPVAIGNKWSCGDPGYSVDESFLMRLIFQIHHNFNTDASRVFIVGMGTGICFAERFASRHPALVRSAVSWTPRTPPPGVGPGPPKEVDSLVITNPAVKSEIPTGTEQKSRMDYDPTGKTILTFLFGSWNQSSASRTEPDTLTLTDLSKYHFKFGFDIAYHLSKRLSVFIESDFMIIRKERQIKSLAWTGNGIHVTATGKGGIVIPYGAGVRYFMSYGRVSPFLFASAGSTFMFIGGGSASGGFGSINKKITKRKENVFRYSVGAGVDVRFSSTVSFQARSSYSFSTMIEPPLASVDRFEGISISAGLSFTTGR